MLKSTAQKMKLKWMKAEVGPNRIILFTLFYKSGRGTPVHQQCVYPFRFTGLKAWFHGVSFPPKSSKNKEMWIVYVLHHNILLTLSLMLFLQILLTCILALWSNTCQSGMWHWENYSSKQAYTLSTFNFCLSLKSSHCLASMNLLGIASNNYTSIFGAEKWRNSGENFICRSLVFTTEKL